MVCGFIWRSKGPCQTQGCTIETVLLSHIILGRYHLSTYVDIAVTKKAYMQTKHSYTYLVIKKL